MLRKSCKTHLSILRDKEIINQEDKGTQDNDGILKIKITRKTPYHPSYRRINKKQMQELS